MTLYGWGLVALLIVCLGAVVTAQLGPIGALLYVTAVLGFGMPFVASVEP